jgi:hypothetical protein
MAKSDLNRLRAEAFKLQDEGWNSFEIAELLAVENPWTVAGWLSWRARNHYDEATGEIVDDLCESTPPTLSVIRGGRL